MCGINGFSWPDEGKIRVMNHAIRHRGPDGQEFFLDDRVSLGHARLSIIDLSDNGRQPMSNEDDTVWIIFNGEIYNFLDLRSQLSQAGHRFKSQTDSEVIIHAYEEYGLDCLHLFRGMWGFCLYDVPRQRFILSRDRFGIKPLYYYAAGDKFIFSSMIAGILQHNLPVAPNDKAIMEYLAFNLEQHNSDTFFEPIRSLLPGHLLIYDLAGGEHTVQRWYTPTPRPLADPQTLRNLFADSVLAHTISDVPIGVCLSGGIDSTAITCILNEQTQLPFRTYSLIVPDNPLNEEKYIREVGRLIRAEQFFTTINEQELAADLEDFILAMEEPVTGLSAYAQYKVFQLARQQGAKVLLDGQGGDEIFAGYIYYFAYYYYELFGRLKWLTLADEMFQVARKFKDTFPHQMFAFLLAPDTLRYRLWQKRLTPWLNHDLLQSVCGDQLDPRWQRMTLRESLTLTLTSTSIPHNLLWEDKSAMRWGIESRVPFLDTPLVEAAMSLPAQQLLNKGETKVIFKQALQGTLPAMVRQRKDKIGFAAPLERIFHEGPIRKLVDDLLAEETFRQRPYWRWQTVKTLLEEHQHGQRNHEQTLWKVLNVELWLRQFFAMS
jgi:asparagine synthase (glutamine-hydrolysing)